MQGNIAQISLGRITYHQIKNVEDWFMGRCSVELPSTDTIGQMNLANKEIQTVPSISAWPISNRKTGFYYDDRMLKHREILNTAGIKDGERTIDASTSHNEHPDRIQKPYFGEWIYGYLLSVWSCCGCRRCIGLAIL